MQTPINDAELSRIIEMTWEDRTPFDIIEQRFGLSEAQVIRLMRRHLKDKAFRHWRARVSGRKTKHRASRPDSVMRGYCRSQYKPAGSG